MFMLLHGSSVITVTSPSTYYVTQGESQVKLWLRISTSSDPQEYAVIQHLSGPCHAHLAVMDITMLQ